MLKDSFYKLISLAPTETGYNAVVELLPEHEIYRGHFPGQPVVPGVCTLTIVRECLAAALGHGVMFRRIRECKFLAAIVPGEAVRLTLVMNLREDGTLRCSVLRGAEVVLKLKAEPAADR